MLPACVGITAHPDDIRYQKFFGHEAISPLFYANIPIFPSEIVDPDKGTGILMVCTFGDQTDVQWWRENSLQLRQILSRDGRFLPVKFGQSGWESQNIKKANENYKRLVGKKLFSAKNEIIELLKDPKNSFNNRWWNNRFINCLASYRHWYLSRFEASASIASKRSAYKDKREDTKTWQKT